MCIWINSDFCIMNYTYILVNIRILLKTSITKMLHTYTWITHIVFVAIRVKSSLVKVLLDTATINTRGRITQPTTFNDGKQENQHTKKGKHFDSRAVHVDLVALKHDRTIDSIIATMNLKNNTYIERKITLIFFFVLSKNISERRARKYMVYKNAYCK